MTKLVVLSSSERQRFDAPPKFNADDRSLYFSLSNNELKLINELRTITNKVGFVLQLGYFKANGKFFTVEQFRRSDIDYVANLLGASPINVGLSSYQKKIPHDHRKRILELLGWQPFDFIQQEKVAEHITWLVQRQLSLKPVFLSIIDFCWQNKIELPSYNTLATSITNTYNHFEQRLINIVADKITRYHREKLDQLAGINPEKTFATSSGWIRYS